MWREAMIRGSFRTMRQVWEACVLCVEHLKVRTETNGKMSTHAPNVDVASLELAYLYINFSECTLNRSCVVLSDRNFSLFSDIRDSFL